MTVRVLLLATSLLTVPPAARSPPAGRLNPAFTIRNHPSFTIWSAQPIRYRRRR